jgi:hypothetical protein
LLRNIIKMKGIKIQPNFILIACMLFIGIYLNTYVSTVLYNENTNKNTSNSYPLHYTVIVSQKSKPEKSEPQTQPIENIPYMRRIMSGIPRDYTILGYLKPVTVTLFKLSDTFEVYPLYGRASRTNAHRWNYHTTTNRLSNVRLPIQSSDGRDCTTDMGCEELYDGHTVRIPGIPSMFQVHLYEKEFI